MATVKTAVSIDESLFERAEALADELAIPRSRVFAMALEQFLEQYDARKILEQLNAVYAEAAPVDEKEAAARRAKHREIVEGTW